MNYDHERRERSDRAQRAVYPMPQVAQGLWSTFFEYLQARDLSPMLAQFNHWYPSHDAGDSFPRIVIPASNSTGRVYWQARAVDDIEPRYQSPPIPRDDSVVVVWPTCRPLTHTVLVEGPMDALAAAECGYIGVALMGNTPPDAVLRFAAKYIYQQPAVVVADADALAEACRIAGQLNAWGYNTVMTNAAPHKDFASMPREARKQRLDVKWVTQKS